MASIVPQPFLFRFSFPIRAVHRIPRKRGAVLDLPASCALPLIGEPLHDRHPAEIRIAWNAKGLGISVRVSGKRLEPICNPHDPTTSDGLQVWIDTRNTQSIHRAGRYCHHFCLLPQGSGAGEDEPIAIACPIARAREEAPLAHSDDIPISVELFDDGYQLETWFPAEVLNGFDPDANAKLGFYYLVQDRELGDQFLSVDRKFPFAHDPSLWSTLEMVSGTRSD